MLRAYAAFGDRKYHEGDTALLKRIIAAFCLSLVLLTSSFTLPVQAVQVALETGPGVQQGGAQLVFATIKVKLLYVRRIPRTSGSILGALAFNDQVKLIGRNVVSTWLEAETPFGVGWIDARFVSTNLSILVLPVTDGSIPPFATVVTSPRVVARAGPADEYAVVGVFRFGTELDVIGLHSQNTYVQVMTPNGPGWIELKLVRVTGDLSLTPYTDKLVLPLAKINAYRVHVHALPTTDSAVFGYAKLGVIYTIVGQSEDGFWLKIKSGDKFGWIYRPLVIVIGYLPWPDRHPLF